MDISYKNTHNFNKNDLENLFLSVGWSSGHYPDKLVTAMKNFRTVYSAWDGEKLIGMVCAMDDGIMNVYVHYLLVNPDYQNSGIGKMLIEKIKEHYRDFFALCSKVRFLGDGCALGFVLHGYSYRKAYPPPFLPPHLSFPVSREVLSAPLLF